jgi:SAM-dependent methyltransferase
MAERDYRSEALQYAMRGIAGTDRLAFGAVARGRYLVNAKVLDLGCGPGRSSRFLRGLGNDVTGVDISREMIAQGKCLDPTGKYVLIDADGALPFADGVFDGFFSSWALLEIGDRMRIELLLMECARVIRPSGCGVIVTNTPEFYSGQWVSSDVDFPENRGPLRSGQPVRARLLPQGVVVRDYFWSDTDYRQFFEAAALRLVETQRPLADAEPGVQWKDELRMAPHVVYVVAR